MRFSAAPIPSTNAHRVPSSRDGVIDAEPIGRILTDAAAPLVIHLVYIGPPDENGYRP